MTTWNIPLQLNNLQAEISNQQVIGLTNPLNANVVGNGKYIAGLSGNPAGASAITLGATQSWVVENTDLTPLIIANNAGVQLGSAGSGYTVIAPTVTPSTDSSTQVATTAFVQSAISGSGGGTLTGVGAGANIGVDNTVPAVPVVRLLSPLTSTLDVGTQDITTTTINANIDILPTTIDGTTATATKAVAITSVGAGGAGNPMLTLTNTNATGSVATEIYKNKPTAGAPGDILYNQSVFGKDSGNNKQEYTRITHTIREANVGSEDGSIEFGCFTNGSFQNYIQINGNDPANGEVNILRPLDLGSGSTGLIKTSVAGGSINITANTTGGVALNSATGEVLLNGGSVRMNAGGVKFFECGGMNPTFSRPLEITESAGTAVFQVNISPQPNLSISGLPIAPSGFLEGSALTGGAGQVITANGGGGWSWQTPTSVPTWFPIAPAAPTGALDMNSNDLTNVANFSWGASAGSTEYLGTTAGIPATIQGSIPINIGGNTYYIPYYN